MTIRKALGLLGMRFVQNRVPQNTFPRTQYYLCNKLARFYSALLGGLLTWTHYRSLIPATNLFLKPSSTQGWI